MNSVCNDDSLSEKAPSLDVMGRASYACALGVLVWRSLVSLISSISSRVSLPQAPSGVFSYLSMPYVIFNHMILLITLPCFALLRWHIWVGVLLICLTSVSDVDLAHGAKNSLNFIKFLCIVPIVGAVMKAFWLAGGLAYAGLVVWPRPYHKSSGLAATRACSTGGASGDSPPRASLRRAATQDAASPALNRLFCGSEPRFTLGGEIEVDAFISPAQVFIRGKKTTQFS